MDETLLALLQVADTKGTMDEFVQAFGVAVAYIQQMKAENASERQGIQRDVSSVVQATLKNAEQRLVKTSTDEWAKIRLRVSQLTNGKDGLAGKDGRDGRDGANGTNGTDGVNGKDGINTEPETGTSIVDKINQSEAKISQDRIQGLADIARMAIANSVGVAATTNFFSGFRAKNLTFNNGVYAGGDLVDISIPVQPNAPSNPHLNQLWLDST